MNKKILSIFVMVMALSLLGVSCNKKTTDPTNDGGSTTTQNKNFNLDIDTGSDKTSPLAVTVAISANAISADAESTAFTLKGTDKDLSGITFTVKSVATDTSVTGHSQDSGITSGVSVTADKKLKFAQNTSVDSGFQTSTTHKGGLKVIITASKEGYNSKDLTLYVLATVQ